MTDGMSEPGVTQHVATDATVAAGWPPIMTVGEPDVIRPICVGGAKYGSVGCSPMCGGVLSPEQPITAAGFPPIRTVGCRPIVMGALNGIGGPG